MRCFGFERLVRRLRNQSVLREQYVFKRSAHDEDEVAAAVAAVFVVATSCRRGHSPRPPQLAASFRRSQSKQRLVSYQVVFAHQTVIKEIGAQPKKV